MKADHINPFIISTYEVFESMLECDIKAGEIRLQTDDQTSLDLIGIIGLSGSAQGTVALKFPVITALSVVGKIMGDKIKSVDVTVIDGIGELVNIIAGTAKANREGHSLSISLPTVVRGTLFNNNVGKKSDWIEVPFSGKLGDFSLAVTFKSNSTKKKERTLESTHSR